MLKNPSIARLTPVIVLLAAAAASLAAPRPGHKAEAKAIYSLLRQMIGSWDGATSKGMREHLDTTEIAGGVVLMELSNQHMATMYHLDTNRVLLTHYCMAGNQPRLKATTLSPDGKSVTFTFLDGTNMANRNVGHMDKVVITFVDKNTFKSNWYWYQNGKESKMEDFTYRRSKAR